MSENNNNNDNKLWSQLKIAWEACAAKHRHWSKEPIQYLDFYWGAGEEFELNDYLKYTLLTHFARDYCISEGVSEGQSGYIRQDGFVFYEDADQEE